MFSTALFGIPLFEWIGYLASIIIAISLLMSSIIKLRWLNMAGGMVFSFYGILIASFPVALLNAFIAFIDIYYLIRIYQKKDYFQILSVQGTSAYLKDFLHFYREDIEKFFPAFQFKPSEHSFQYFVLRDLNPAGVIIGDRTENKSIHIELDFAAPAYRDFQTGAFFLKEMESAFAEEGYERYETYSDDTQHVRYLKNLGFSLVREEEGRRLFSRSFG